MKTVEKVLLTGVAIFTFCSTVNAQDSQSNQFANDDDIVSLIAPYPSDVRDAILNVSQYPQKLVRIERIQARSSQSFQDMLTPYPRAVQEKFYDLARYPDLIHQLVSAGSKSSDQVKTLTASYTEELRASVSDLYPAHLSDLEAMDEKFQQSQSDLENIISSLPQQAQTDMRKIVAMPDVMNLLTDRIDLTVSLGEAYKNDPDGVRQDLNKLNAQRTAEDARELDAYKGKVANDPQLQNEMKASAQDFANNYSSQGNGTPTVINNYYNTNPYPYWFGYPYWYPTAMWYPRPLYYHTGFYIGAGGNMVILGLPSYGYSNWFYHYGYRHYPRMYGWYNGYYAAYRSYRPAWSYGYNSYSRERYYNRSRDAYRRSDYNNYGNNGRTRSTDNMATRGTQMQSSRGRFDNNMSRSRNEGMSQGRMFGHKSQNFGSPNNGSGGPSMFSGHSTQRFQQRSMGGGGFQRGGGNGLQRNFNGGGGMGGNFGGGHVGGGHSRGRN